MKARDKNDRVYVQEKLDGSCCAVALLNGELIPLGRAGYRALTSNYEMHKHFHNWVMLNEAKFREILHERERIVGEWLMQAHGTTYDLTGRDPFVAFDIMRDGHSRMPVEDFLSRVDGAFSTPHLIASEQIPVEEAMARLGEFGFYGATEPVEGAMWRVERNGKVDFLCKFVRPDKVDGKYLNGEPVWNLHPSQLWG